MAAKYKLLQRANASEHYPYSWKLFASWDYAITDANTAVLRKRYISMSLKVRLPARTFTHCSEESSVSLCVCVALVQSAI